MLFGELTSSDLTDDGDLDLSRIGQLFLDLILDLTGKLMTCQIIQLSSGTTITRTSRPAWIA